jgi:hypothetical protein
MPLENSLDIYLKDRSEPGKLLAVKPRDKLIWISLKLKTVIMYYCEYKIYVLVINRIPVNEFRACYF